MAMIFSRFARLGILFVGKDDCCMVEVGRFKGYAQVNSSIIDAITRHNGTVSIPQPSDRKDVKT